MKEEYEINRKEFQEYLKQKGRVKGYVFKIDYNYVLKNFGVKGLETLESRFKELGYNLSYSDVAGEDYYPAGLRALSVAVMKDVFKMSDKDVEEMGYNAPSISIPIRFLINIFASIELILGNADRIWKNHFNVGSIEIMDYSKKDKKVIVALKGYRGHPYYCSFLRGYMKRLAGFVLKNNNPKVTQTKCVFKGGAYHEFLIRWD